MAYLAIVGLLNLILVHFDLQFVLVTHLHQRLSQLAFKVLLVAIVQLNHTRLMTSLCLPQFLLEDYQQNPFHSQLQKHVLQVDADVIKGKKEVENGQGV